MDGIGEVLKTPLVSVSIISKIEQMDAISNIDAILSESDGIMVARGDLGVYVGNEKIPVIQKELIDVCASLNGINLTLDVGVDNTRHGLPFGTPWSLADIRNYMQPKIALWQTRKIK